MDAHEYPNYESYPSFIIRDDGAFVFCREFIYTFPWNKDRFVVVPAGYITNFGSIPWFGRVFVSPIDEHIRVATLIHDWMVQEFKYSVSGAKVHPYFYDWSDPAKIGIRLYDWAQSAWVLREIMKHDGAPRWKRFIVYAAVRAHGFFSKKK